MSGWIDVSVPLSEGTVCWPGDRRFDRLEDVISQDELRAIFERYQKVAGYHVQQVGRAQG